MRSVTAQEDSTRLYNSRVKEAEGLILRSDDKMLLL